MSITKLLSLWCPANIRDSHMEPSWSSPSPQRHRDKDFFFGYIFFKAKAHPAATDNPCPSDPVECSTLGTEWLTWPAKKESFLW